MVTDKQNRKYRWTLSVGEIPAFVIKRIQIDHMNKLVHVEFFELYSSTGGFHALKLWQSPVITGGMMFVTYDENGQWLYRTFFCSKSDRMPIVGHTTEFAYDDSSPASRNMIIQYETEVIEFNPAVIPPDKIERAVDNMS